MKTPSVSEMASRLKPVSVCVAVTLAPGSTPPLESLIVPVICAVACAITVPADRSTTINPQNNVRSARLILTLLPMYTRC